MLTFLNKPLPVKEIIFSGLKSYKEVFSKIWLISLFNAICYGLIFYIVNLQGQIIPQKAATATSTTAVTTPLSGMGQAFGGIMNIVGLLLVLFFFSVLLHRIYNIFLGQNLPLGKSFSTAGRKYFKVVIASVIILALVLLIALLTLAIFYALSPWIAVIISLIPFMFVYMLFYFVVPSIVLDDVKFFSSFRNSIRLIRGKWWHVFMTMLPFTFVFSMSSLMILKFLQNILFANVIANVLLYLFLFPLLPIYVSYLYHDLKLRKEIAKSKVLNQVA